MKLKFSCVTLLLCFLVTNAQVKNDNLLFKVGDDPVYVSEFLRVYNKNLDLVQDESQKDVDQYLSLFINYKLKLKEAVALGFDKKPTYIRELSSYKRQLTKNFLVDRKVTDELIEEAYDRVSHDVKASHILVRLLEDASPKDTLDAYNKILNLRDRCKKEGFEKVRAEVHNGETIFGENLGYFSGFKMVYKFENVAYNTPVGEISKPFKTQFGYHILHVMDKRKSRGERTVAHIMVVDKKEDTSSSSSEIRINDIYKKLNQGEAFDALAKQFSDDKNSSSKGGKLTPFYSGQLSSKIFEDTAFSLESEGEISKPIKSEFGWHIIKLINKKPVQPFEKIKGELEVKVKRDSRSNLIESATKEKLRKKYNVKSNQNDIDYFTSILNDKYYKGTWVLPESFPGDKILFKIENKQFLYKDFGDVLVKNQNGLKKNVSISSIVKNTYNNFLDNSLKQYQEDNLEKENVDFANVIQEYRDGLLLYDLMDNTIWNLDKNDSIGIKKFYEKNKSNYMWPERIDAVVATSSKQKVLKKVSKLIDKKVSLTEIKDLVNKDDIIDVIFTTGVMDSTHQSLPKKIKFEKGISKIYKHNDSYVLVQVKSVLPKAQKTLDESKGLVVSDYQAFKEEEWLKELKKKYKVEVNNEALLLAKNKIKNNK